ncbi:hypothetical protein [Streptomyces tailanensis]|uniref:hypothetical protein n=1 Tax=Streptomyces tailanensis TaxID=2569858 RepID=UPI00155A35DA|nr:hypothetical protein [Streptomyces tailanensis]
MRNKIRMTAAAITVALALGVAAPTASAVETGRTPTTASAQLTAGGVRDAGTLSLGATAGQNAASTSPGAITQGGVEAQGLGSAARKLVDKIVNSRYGKAAIKAAKKGRAAFKNWVDSLSNFNPLKWAIKAAPAYVIDEVITYLVNHF